VGLALTMSESLVLTFTECGIYFNKHKRMRPDDLWAGATRTHKTPKLESELPHLGVRSSPRLHRSTSDHDESPRKRQRSGKMPHPSPRMATRASVKTESGRPKGKALDFSEGMFSPTSTSGTSPANGAGIGALGNGNRGGGEVGEVDIESLLAQFANDQPGFNLDALFANVGDGSGPGGQEMKSLLSAFEGVTDEGASGSAVQNKEGTA